MRHVEENMQIMCVRWFGLQYPQFSDRLHHSPNGGRRNAREGARFKAMGTRAGFPDLFLAVARDGWHGLFVEMKSDEGRQSAGQREWQRIAAEEGYRYEVCRSFDDFEKIVNEYLKNE